MAGIVVVGAGQAGAALVARLRARGHDGPLTLIGEEPVPPYQRPPLSKKYLLGELEEERLYLRPPRFYADHAIALRLGERVSAIDRKGRFVTVAGERIAYDRLVLATGGRARALPQSRGGRLGGVYLMRTLADADRVAPEFRPGRRVLILGGGYVGLEAAAVAAQKGLEVTLLSAHGRILRRTASAATAGHVRALHRAHGVDIREGVGIERLTGASQVDGALLSDGSRIEADFVLLGIGLDPATELAGAAGLEVADGIATDAFGCTGDPAIWAAGDCASFPWRGGRIRLESVQNAIDQAESVADNMLGAARPYDPLPWFWSDQYDVKLQIAGLGEGHDRLVLRGGPDGPPQSVWYFAGPRLICVDAMNDARAYMVGKRLIEAGRSPDPLTLADPATDLRALLA